jgi:hypothetical protein
VSQTETQAETKLSPETIKAALYPHLFPQEEGINTFAVLDGASVPGLLGQLNGDTAPESVCLYSGELAPDVAAAAPYLVRLKPESPFTDWILTEGWGKHWGIFAITKADLVKVRKPFRTFLMVKSPEGRQLYFRYYDPRVLRVYLPTCNAQEAAYIFGPVMHYLLEAEPTALLCFSQGEGRPQVEQIRLAR